MKIVQINAVYKTSSTGRTTFEMHHALKEKGFESYVFCCNEHIPSDNVFRVGSHFDHKVHALCSRVFGLQGYFSHRATRKLIKQIRCISPDVVILRNLHNNYLNIPQLLKFLADINCGVINVLHDCWSFTGHCSYYSYDNCSKWQTECNHCHLLSTGNKSLFFDNSTKVFRMKKRLFQALNNFAVIGVSKWIANEGKHSPIFSNARMITHIYNWINLDVFKPRDTTALREKMKISPKQFVALGVSQGWSVKKGLPHFLSIAQKLPDVTFIMVGAMTCDVELPSNIIVIPQTSSVDELCQYYSLADVFLNFSVQETFGKVTAEAVSCGTPLIVNDTTATPELCGDGCGYIIHDNNEDEAIAAMGKIKENGKNFYTKNCRQFAIDNFDMINGIDSYIKVFNKLCESKK